MHERPAHHFYPETYPLGDLAVSHQAEAVFQRPEGGLPVDRISMGCGCTTYTLTPTELRVTLSAGELPEGVKEQGLTSYEVSKNVTVIFEDDTFQNLWVTARIYEVDEVSPPVA